MTNSMECCSIDDLLSTIDNIQKRLGLYKIKKNNLTNSTKVYMDDLDILKNRRQTIESAKQYYLKVIDELYMHSISEMEEFVNYVLGEVFYDKSYKIRLDLVNKYNKSITFYLIDEQKVLELPLRKGNGKGIKAVVSFILLTYYLLRQKSPYLFLDESFVNISEGYVERFFSFVKVLCAQQNMAIILITHDQRFIPYADVIFKVDNGEVTKCQQ